MEEDEIPHMQAKNIKYLREKTGLDILQLAEMTGTDPSTIFQLEKEGRKIDFINDYITAIPLCDYFTIHLDDMWFTDIETRMNLSASHFAALRAERSQEKEIDRKQFRKEAYENDHDEDEEHVTRLAAARNIAKVMEQTSAIEKEYQNLRREGLIGKIDSFEPSDEK